MDMTSQQSSSLQFRGRKLVLNYTDGSPCPSPSDASSSRKRKILDDDDDDDKKDKDDKDDKKDKDDEKKDKDDDDKKDKPVESTRRKSTIMSFLCERDLISPQATISFVGTMDSCSYFFEVRSPAACGGAALGSDSGVGPGGVFGIM
jgi:cation-dependent mannose-6-phosphate receptor